jgi:hypothetical protein
METRSSANSSIPFQQVSHEFDFQIFSFSASTPFVFFLCLAPEQCLSWYTGSYYQKKVWLLCSRDEDEDLYGDSPVPPPSGKKLGLYSWTSLYERSLLCISLCQYDFDFIFYNPCIVWISAAAVSSFDPSFPSQHLILVGQFVESRMTRRSNPPME